MVIIFLKLNRFLIKVVIRNNIIDENYENYKNLKLSHESI
jgi:hypothetical protein